MWNLLLKAVRIFLIFTMVVWVENLVATMSGFPAYLITLNLTGFILTGWVIYKLPILLKLLEEA